MDVNEWISDECSDEGTRGVHILRTSVTHLLIYIHQKKNIAVSVLNGPLVFINSYFMRFKFSVKY